jgi:hypothetical protein
MQVSAPVLHSQALSHDSHSFIWLSWLRTAAIDFAGVMVVAMVYLDLPTSLLPSLVHPGAYDCLWFLLLAAMVCAMVHAIVWARRMVPLAIVSDTIHRRRMSDASQSERVRRE